MKRSTERIVTTHVGSLPRPPDLLDMIQAKERGGSFDAAAFAARVKSAVAEVVRRQAEAGIDIIADGEMGRFGFIPYVNERLTGLEARPNPRSEGTWARSREHLAFPEYYAWAAQMPGAAGGAQRAQWVCTGPIVYKGHEALARDIDNLKAALAPVRYEDAFMPAVSPAQLAGWNKNEFYKTDEEFGLALADALREEYRAIVDAGFLLQIDDPDLPDGWACLPDITLPDYRNYAALRIDALNHALRDIAPEKIRLHVCWGSFHGPHHDDIPLKDIIDLIFRVRAGSYSIEASNPCHEHEWRVFEEVKLPDGATLVPGVVGHCTDFIEHPDLVAERLVRYANLVGRENVLAGTDCGLGTRVGHPSICWAKFEALAEGARRATKLLWGGDQV
jgi:5-methyltetrahydropteroyltriglutamate--homocysteine methyltransferase